jgi:hypothetical protein
MTSLRGAVNSLSESNLICFVLLLGTNDCVWKVATADDLSSLLFFSVRRYADVIRSVFTASHYRVQ